VTSDIENLVLEHLRQIRAGQERLGQDMREVKERLGIIEQQAAALHAQYANLSVRIDRMEVRIEHIEKRLGLIEA
jgi:prefoldin subunit 5